MAKKNRASLVKALATFTGQVAGSVEGTIEAARNAAAAVHPVSVGSHSNDEGSNQEVRFEHSDVNWRGLIIGGACLLIGVWLTVGLIYFYFSYLKDYRARVSPPPLPVALHGNPAPPEPRLQTSPTYDLTTFRAHEDWELTHYFWIDKSKHQVAIPIEQAIQMTAQRGIPPQKTPPNSTLTPPESGTRLTGFEGKVEPEPR